MILFRFFPFSSPWIVRYHLGKARTILDIGCGDGSFMKKINTDNKYQITGLELYDPYIKKALKTGVYKQIKKMDLNKIIIKKKSYDVVLALQVIEHLSKKEGIELIKKIESIAKNKVIITTPNGFVNYDPFENLDNNKLQKHKSGWNINELTNYKYKVYGQGSYFIYRSDSILYKFRKLKYLFAVLSYLVSPFTYFLPFSAAYLVAVKNVRSNK